MIFSFPENSNDLFKFDGNELNSFIRLYVQLRKYAAEYLSEKLNESVEEDEISFDEACVYRTYRYNNSCNCHPEWITDTDYYDLNEFKTWMNQKGKEFYV